MTSDGIERSSEDLLTLELLWNSLSVGDKIELEADLTVGESTLKAGLLYEIVAKHGKEQGALYDALYVQIQDTSELIPVSPAFVANYVISENQYYIS